jgi:energy-converting hydrogenase Eha subunit F
LTAYVIPMSRPIQSSTDYSGFWVWSAPERVNDFETAHCRI